MGCNPPPIRAALHDHQRWNNCSRRPSEGTGNVASDLYLDIESAEDVLDLDDDRLDFNN
jgi:hypothetical protein